LPLFCITQWEIIKIPSFTQRNGISVAITAFKITKFIEFTKIKAGLKTTKYLVWASLGKPSSLAFFHVISFLLSFEGLHAAVDTTSPHYKVYYTDNTRIWQGGYLKLSYLHPHPTDTKHSKTLHQTGKFAQYAHTK
jgi:hypothetical protein